MTGCMIHTSSVRMTNGTIVANASTRHVDAILSTHDPGL